MHKIKSLKKFKKDLARYKEAISQIKNKKTKTEYERLLESFVHYSDLIDLNHDTIYGNGMINPAVLKENIITMSQIRSNLETLANQVK